AEFQKKCLGKMSEVAGGGRTVLFVSHNMPVVSKLCSRTIVLEQGRIAYDGATAGGIAAYTAGAASLAGVPLSERDDRRGNGKLRFTDARIAGAAANRLAMGEDVRLTLTLAPSGRVRAANVSVLVLNAWDQIVLRLSTLESGR